MSCCLRRNVAYASGLRDHNDGRSSCSCEPGGNCKSPSGPTAQSTWSMLEPANCRAYGFVGREPANGSNARATLRAVGDMSNRFSRRIQVFSIGEACNRIVVEATIIGCRDRYAMQRGSHRAHLHHASAALGASLHVQQNRCIRDLTGSAKRRQKKLAWLGTVFDHVHEPLMNRIGQRRVTMVRTTIPVLLRSVPVLLETL